MAIRKLSRRDRAKDLDVSEGTIRNYLRDAKAESVRNRYAPGQSEADICDGGDLRVAGNVILSLISPSCAIGLLVPAVMLMLLMVNVPLALLWMLGGSSVSRQTSTGGTTCPATMIPR